MAKKESVTPRINEALEGNKWRNNVAEINYEFLRTESNLPVDTDSRNPLVFHIPAQAGWHLDTQNIRLKLKVKIEKKKTDGTYEDVGGADKVCVYPNFLHSLFEESLLYVGGNLVESRQREYARTAYLSTLLDKKETDDELEAQYWYADNLGIIEEIDVDRLLAGKLPNQWWRYMNIKGGKVLDLTGRVNSDIWQCDFPFPPTTDVVLKLFPSKSIDCFVAVSTDPETPQTYKATIQDASLVIPHVRLNKAIAKTETYHYVEHKIQSYLHSAGKMEFGPQVITSTQPNKVVVGIINEARNLGSWSTSRFHFGPHDISNVLFNLGTKNLPFVFGFDNIDVAGGSYIEPWLALCDLSKSHIPRNHFDRGLSLFVADTTLNNRGNYYLDKPLKTSLGLYAKFSKASTENLYFVVYIVSSGKFKFDEFGVLHFF
jgi:hypothetical protein